MKIQPARLFTIVTLIIGITLISGFFNIIADADEGANATGSTRASHTPVTGSPIYLLGQVSSRKDSGSAWEPVLSQTIIQEGDEIQTGSFGHAQFDFGDSLSLIIFPDTHIICGSSNQTDDSSIFVFYQLNGTAAWKIQLTGTQPTFMLNTPDNKTIMVNHTIETVFHIDQQNTVRIFQGSAFITSSSDKADDDLVYTKITSGSTSIDTAFTHAQIQFPTEKTEGMIEYPTGLKLGIENDSFIAEGTFKGFLFRNVDLDSIYFYDYFAPLSLHLSTDGQDTIDVDFNSYSPEAKGFSISKLTVQQASEVTIEIQDDGVSIQSSSDVTYTLELNNQEVHRFQLLDMELGSKEIHSYQILDNTKLSDPNVRSVEFRLDENGDGKDDEVLEVHTLMTYEDIMDDLDEDDDSSNDSFIVIVVILIALFVVLGYFAVKRDGRFNGDKKETSENNAPIDSQTPKETDEESTSEKISQESSAQEENAPIEDSDTMQDLGVPEEVTPPAMTQDEDSGTEETQDSIAEDLIQRKEDMILKEDFESIEDQDEENEKKAADDEDDLESQEEEDVPPEVPDDDPTGLPEETLSDEVPPEIPVDDEISDGPDEIPLEIPMDESHDEASIDEVPPEVPVDDTPQEVPVDDTPPEVPLDDPQPESPSDDEPSEAPDDDAEPESSSDEVPPEVPLDESQPESSADDEPPETPEDDAEPESSSDEMPAELPEDDSQPDIQSEDQQSDESTESDDVDDGSIGSPLDEAPPEAPVDLPAEDTSAPASEETADSDLPTDNIEEESEPVDTLEDLGFASKSPKAEMVAPEPVHEEPEDPDSIESLVQEIGSDQTPVELEEISQEDIERGFEVIHTLRRDVDQIALEEHEDEWWRSWEKNFRDEITHLLEHRNESNE